MRPSQITVLLLIGVSLLWTGAAAIECYEARTSDGGQVLTGTGAFVLNDAGTAAVYNIVCCNGCNIKTALVQIVSDDEGVLLELSGTCPLKGEWTNLDPVPLTPARVQALQQGKLKLHVFAQDPNCEAGGIGTIVPISCEE